MNDPVYGWMAALVLLGIVGTYVAVWGGEIHRKLKDAEDCQRRYSALWDEHKQLQRQLAWYKRQEQRQAGRN